MTSEDDASLLPTKSCLSNIDMDIISDTSTLLNLINEEMPEEKLALLLTSSITTSTAQFYAIHLENIRIAGIIEQLLSTPNYALESDAKRICSGIAINNTLNTLNCSDCPLGNLFVYACCRGFRSGHLRKLRRLILRGNQINDGAWIHYYTDQQCRSNHRRRDASLPCLRVLDLPTMISHRSGIPIIDLNLSGNLIVASSITALCQACAKRETHRVTRLRRLALNETGWSLAGIRALSDWLKLSDCSLTALELNDCNLSDAALNELALAIGVNTSLRSLHYDGNRFSINPLTLFSEALRINRHLEHLIIDVFEAITRNPSVHLLDSSSLSENEEQQQRDNRPETEDNRDEAVTGLWILTSAVRQNLTLNTLECAIPGQVAAICQPMWQQLCSNRERFHAMHRNALQTFHVARILLNSWQNAIAATTCTNLAWLRLPFELLERLFFFIAPLLSMEQLRYILHYALYRL
ncbi:hypothetical protein BDF22DRAFT_689544 [Syncephalis plumigaleata]|nr:hypothetical protein BDF22DRAFT_689544 [Syncephalis plumigaleata]